TDGSYNNSSGPLWGGHTDNNADPTRPASYLHNPSVFGQTVTFTAIVSAVKPGSGTPAGTVDFIIDGSTVKSGVALSNGQATFQTSTLAVSTTPHTVTVNFTDTDGSYNNSSGSLSGGQTVNKANTSVALSSNVNPSLFGDNVTFTAAVSAVEPGAGTPAGTVACIIDGSTVTSGVTLDSNGQATYQTSSLTVTGTPHTVTVNFTDTDGNYNNSSGSLAGGQSVRYQSAVAVSSDNNPSIFGQTVTFTATVGAVSPGSATPAGTVGFIIDGSTVASGVTLDSNGQATYQTSTLVVSATPHTVTVNFHDTDGLFLDSSGSLSGGQTVNRADTSVAVSSDLNPSVFGQMVTFTA